MKKKKTMKTKFSTELIYSFNKKLLNWSFPFFLKLLNKLHMYAKKQEIKRKNDEGYFKCLYHKFKSKILSEKE